MDNNKDTRRLFDEATHIESQLQAIRNIDTDDAYRQVQRTLRRRHRRTPATPLFYRIAAIMLLPLTIATIALWHMYSNRPTKSVAIATVEVAAPMGATARVTLPDSSVVWLNAGSRIAYPQAFAPERRTVSLTGEAFFSVRSDHKHPFYVSLADGLRVMAHGTRFNVCAYDGEQDIEMTLVRGAIDIQQGTRTLHRLAPDEQAVYNRSSRTCTLRRVNTEEYASWKDGRLVFRDMPLGKVFEQLGRRFSTDINIHDRSLADYKIRAIFSNESLTQILNDIKLVAPIRWSATAGATESGHKATIDIYHD